MVSVHFLFNAVLLVLLFPPIDNTTIDLNRNVSISVVAIKRIVGQLRPSTLIVLTCGSQINDKINDLLKSLKPLTPMYVVQADIK